jgi:hypothetical protein
VPRSLDEEQREVSSRPTEPNSPWRGFDVRTRAGALAPGGVVGDGRYRLLAQFGEHSRLAAQLWRARDGQLARDVALTVLLGDGADHTAAAAARRVLERAAHAASFEHPAVARVVDVLSLGSGLVPSEGILGMVVAEWSPGTDLTDLLAQGPVTAAGAATLLEPLADAAERAHYTGLVLGLDHPQRVRIGPDGALRLAFPGPRPEAVLADDVRGLGALLYLLLSTYWPLDAGPEALQQAPRQPGGGLVTPRELRPRTSAELSSLAMRCIESSANGIRTPAAVLSVLEGIAADEPRSGQPGQLGQPGGDASGAGAAAGSGDAADEGVWTTKRPVRDPRRTRRLVLIAGVLCAATIALVVWIAMGVIGFFAGDNAEGAGGPALQPTTTAAPRATRRAAPPPSNASTPAGLVLGAPVAPSTVTVYTPGGTPDHAGEVSNVTDDDPQTTWQTRYYADDFGSPSGPEKGVGLLATFRSPTRFAQVDIRSPSPGTKVQIRTAEGPDPDLGQTTVIGETRPALTNGLTKVQLAKAPPTKHLIVWITGLTKRPDGRFQSSIGSVSFVSARSG